MSAFANSVKGWLNAGLGLIYPEICQLCAKARATPAEGYVCDGCQAKVRFIQPPSSAAWRMRNSVWPPTSSTPG